MTPRAAVRSAAASCRPGSWRAASDRRAGCRGSARRDSAGCVSASTGDARKWIPAARTATAPTYRAASGSCAASLTRERCRGKIHRMSLPDRYPSRIVCLTEETTETLYLLEEDWRIVGISGFTVRPPRARREKPKVSAFISAKVDRIRELRPDLVLGFSDLQADIAAQLVRLGLNVFVFNHRDVAGILQMIRVLGGMIGCEAKAAALATRLEQGLDQVRAAAARFERRPRVYFEEWDEPMISRIRWVSELIGIAGGEDR